MSRPSPDTLLAVAEAVRDARSTAQQTGVNLRHAETLAVDCEDVRKCIADVRVMLDTALVDIGWIRSELGRMALTAGPKARRDYRRR